MKFNIITNLANGVGLEQDYRMLRAELESRGHAVQGVQFNDAAIIAPPADVNIFLEVVAERFFAAANAQWVVPNAEWWFSGWNCFLGKFQKILAKTRDCEQIFAGSKRCQFLGWKSRSLYDPSVKRYPIFLHVAGKSQTKNTQAVVDAWLSREIDARLTIVSEHLLPRQDERITYLHRVADDELVYLMNSHRFHVMPSAYEGWGHALHEALGVGAVLLTVDAPPMNELAPIIGIPSAGSYPVLAAQAHRINSSDVLKGAKQALRLSDAEADVMAIAARCNFKSECDEFNSRLDQLLSEAA